MTISFCAPGFAILFAAAFGALAATTKPTPTPTPSPRLTGGFGKTPAGSASHGTEKKKVRITNESLTTEPDKGKVTTSSRPAPTPPAREADAGERASAEAALNEEYWRGEARRLHDRVAELKETIVHLQDESQKLENDFYAWDDGAYRDRVIKPAWDKAREDLVTARRELPIAEKELADLPDRARKAGALPGWIRE
jgi:hypothetical protein